ncbi:MAG: alkaline phosphatase, partial [Bacteroidia bacterium]|nr:alkaline phosphatase [Bacteroidia bacterium]
LAKVKEYVEVLKNKNIELNVDNYMEQIPADSLSKSALIGWTTSSHTGGAVPVFAIGASSELFAGRQDNTDLPKKICKAMGVEF